VGSSRRTLTLAILAAALTAACGDPGYGLWAKNDRDSAVIVRRETDRWLLPAHSSGIVFVTLGPPQDAPPVDYEILDANTCTLIGRERVAWATSTSPVIIVGPSPTIGSIPAESLSDSQLASSELCPGPADGWSLWVVNTTPKSFFIESQDGANVESAPIKPNVTTYALGGGATIGAANESSTLELFDDSCRLLDTQARSGWGPFKATIDKNGLIIEKGLPAPAQTLPNELTTFGDHCRSMTVASPGRSGLK
jgi:hypothetical protein